MERGQFPLRKWISNSSEIVSAVPVEHREEATSLSIEEDKSIKTIGIRWFPKSDAFGLSVFSPDLSKPITKRNILSITAKIFDPLGWLSPFTVKFKILLQQLWKEGLGWDTVLSSSYQVLWTKYCKEIEKLQSFRIPRCMVLSHVQSNSPNNEITYELHGFSDSSQNAYSACVYIRTIDTKGLSSIILVAAKTKVAPIKEETIPRLELCGGVLLVKLIKIVRDSIKLSFSVLRCWTDSTIVLDWLKSDKKLPVFVSNRIRKIQSSYPSSLWFHCPGEDNPADSASRGIDVESFINHSLWLTGPVWLSTAKFEDNFQVLSHSIQIDESQIGNLISNCSSFSKLKRICAFIIRFVNNCRKKKSNRNFDVLSVSELKAALIVIIKQVQSESFPEEIRKVSRNKSPKSYMKFLSPFLDNGILRVGGRLSKSGLSYDQKHPILLPQKHHFTEILIRYFHLMHLHAGPQLLLAIIRNQFWIHNGRDIIRRIVRKCIICHRQTAQSASQLMGQLPSPRVTFSRPFSKTGMDFAGPFYISSRPGRNPSKLKMYVAIFVCMGVRAVHLELVNDLSTPSFVAALIRFISRRGLPSDLYSDGGKNFVGASNEMMELVKFFTNKRHQSELNDYFASKGINYNFNPPLAPHHGGLWEAGVKSMKFHLKRVIGDRSLTIEEFLTLLCQVEATLNSRPLTQMSTDPADFSVLTPGHFLIGDSMHSIPQHDVTHLTTNRLSRWQAVQQQSQHFCRRWTSEYLSQLLSRPKWCHPLPNIQPGILVLFKDEESSFISTAWKLARVLSIYPGSDGLVRVCEIKTSSGKIFKRPISKISPLPIYE